MKKMKVYTMTYKNGTVEEMSEGILKERLKEGRKLIKIMQPYLYKKLDDYTEFMKLRTKFFRAVFGPSGNDYGNIHILTMNAILLEDCVPYKFHVYNKGEEDMYYMILDDTPLVPVEVIGEMCDEDYTFSESIEQQNI